MDQVLQDAGTEFCHRRGIRPQGFVSFWEGKPERHSAAFPEPANYRPNALLVDLATGLVRVAVGGDRDCGAKAWRKA
jgi:hypothetical protein